MLDDLTRVLNGLVCADPRVEREIYAGLRATVAGHVARESGGLSGRGTGLNLTEVVHEAWVRLQSTDHWESRAHFFGAASRAARQVLVDHARKRATEARWRERSVAPAPPEREDPRPLLELDRALAALHEEHPRAGRVAEMRLFGDLPATMISEVLGITARTAQRDWRFAQAWLGARLLGAASEDGARGAGDA